MNEHNNEFIGALERMQDNLRKARKEYDNKMDDAKKLLDEAISVWVSYAKLQPESAWMVIHLLKDALFALDRYNEIEIILKETDK